MSDKFDTVLRVYKTQLNICVARGFDLTPFQQEARINPEIILSQIPPDKQTIQGIREYLSQTYYKVGGDEILMIAYLNPRRGDQTLGVDYAREVVLKYQKLIDQNPAADIQGIVITPLPLSSESIKSLPASIRIFSERELSFDIMTSKLARSHRRLSEMEVRTLLTNLGIPKTNLSILRLSDPVVKYHGWKTGDVIQIERDFSYLDVATPIQYAYRVILNI